MSFDYSDFKYRPAVWGIILNAENKVLIVQSYFYKNDEWGLIGGGVEKGESETEALQRELLEECGTDNFQFLYMSPTYITYDWAEDVIKSRFEDTGRKFKGQTRRVYVLKYLGKESEMVFQEDEIKAHLWVDISDLEKYLKFKGQFEQIIGVLNDYFALSQVETGI